MMPSDIEREPAPRRPGPRADEPVRDVRRLDRHLAALDHRHPFAMLHLELLRPLAHRHQDDDDAGNHAHDEHELANRSSASI